MIIPHLNKSCNPYCFCGRIFLMTSMATQEKSFNSPANPVNRQEDGKWDRGGKLNLKRKSSPQIRLSAPILSPCLTGVPLNLRNSIQNQVRNNFQVHPGKHRLFHFHLSYHQAYSGLSRIPAHHLVKCIRRFYPLRSQNRPSAA